jgi:GTP-binding protein EngB required for normal cell division
MNELHNALTYLTSFAATGSILAPDEIRPLHRLQQDAKFVSSQIPRLILVGEFKAGKSSLMNALLKGQYAATDILEMTSWIARYWPSDTPFCRIVHHDGRETEVPPDDFRQKCERRAFSEDDLAQIARVDVGVPIHEMTFSIIDCPGFGSVTRENERRMIDALQDADVLVWVVDVDSIGGMREGALLKKLLAQGVPHIAVLTKCDLVSDTDVCDIREYLRDEFTLEPGNIFATSARIALKEALDNGGMSDESGIPLLSAFLRNDIATRHAELRRQAERAHTRRLCEQALLLVERLLHELSGRKEILDRFRHIAESMRQAVQAQLEMEVEGMVRDRMFAGHRQAIVDGIETSLRSGKGALTQETITGIFKDHLGENYLDRFWQEISTSMTASASELWAKKLKDVQVELEEIFQQFQSSSWHELAVTYSPQAIALNIAAISEATFSTALKTSLGIAGVATVYAAATANVSLFAAATGVGIPIAAIGAAVSSALFYIQKNRSQAAAELEATVLLDSYVKHFIEEILRPHLFPQIAQLNEGIARQVIAGFERNLMAGLPDRCLDEMLQEAVQLKDALQPLAGTRLLQ